MPKIELTWKEVAMYVVAIDWPENEPLPEIGTDGGEDGSTWFGVVDAQKPKWPITGLHSVDDRELVMVEPAEESQFDEPDPPVMSEVVNELATVVSILETVMAHYKHKMPPGDQISRTVALDRARALLEKLQPTEDHHDEPS